MGGQNEFQAWESFAIKEVSNKYEEVELIAGSVKT